MFKRLGSPKRLYPLYSQYDESSFSLDSPDDFLEAARLNCKWIRRNQAPLPWRTAEVYFNIAADAFTENGDLINASICKYEWGRWKLENYDYGHHDGEKDAVQLIREYIHFFKQNSKDVPRTGLIEPYFDLGCAYFNSNYSAKYSLAIKHFEKARTLYFENGIQMIAPEFLRDLYSNLATAYIRNNNNEKALEMNRLKKKLFQKLKPVGGTL